MSKNMAALFLLVSVLAMLLGTGQCEGDCGENQVWSECGSSCPKTCEDVPSKGDPMMCPTVCKKGCFCEEGYIWSGKSGRCVIQTKCSQKG